MTNIPLRFFHAPRPWDFEKVYLLRKSSNNKSGECSVLLYSSLVTTAICSFGLVFPLLQRNINASVE